MNFNQTMRALQACSTEEGVKVSIDNCDYSTEDREAILSSYQPITIVHGVAVSSYDLKDLSNSKSISSSNFKLKKGTRYLVVFKGDHSMRIAELDSKDNCVALTRWK